MAQAVNFASEDVEIGLQAFKARPHRLSRGVGDCSRFRSPSLTRTAARLLDQVIHPHHAACRSLRRPRLLRIPP